MFNQVGRLVNPLGPTGQGLGTFSLVILEAMAGGQVSRRVIDPQALGLGTAPTSALVGGTPVGNAEILRQVLRRGRYGGTVGGGGEWGGVGQADGAEGVVG